MTVLYIVATPIGNLEDITFRALRVLREVGIVAAEDTRTTRKLLTCYNINQTLTSYNEHNKSVKIPRLMETLKTKPVALVSEAGAPCVSDPGYELVLKAIESGACGPHTRALRPHHRLGCVRSCLWSPYPGPPPSPPPWLCPGFQSRVSNSWDSFHAVRDTDYDCWSHSGPNQAPLWLSRRLTG